MAIFIETTSTSTTTATVSAGIVTSESATETSPETGIVTSSETATSGQSTESSKKYQPRKRRSTEYFITFSSYE